MNQMSVTKSRTRTFNAGAIVTSKTKVRQNGVTHQKVFSECLRETIFYFPMNDIC